MNGGEITIIALLLSNLFLTAYLHGKPRKDKHNFFINLGQTVLALLIYYWAGLFR